MDPATKNRNDRQDKKFLRRLNKLRADKRTQHILNSQCKKQKAIEKKRNKQQPNKK